MPFPECQSLRIAIVGSPSPSVVDLLTLNMSLGVLPAISSKIFVILCKTFLAREPLLKISATAVAASRSAFRRGTESCFKNLNM